MKPTTTLVSKKTADQLKEHSDRLDRIDTAVVSFVAIAEQVKKHNDRLFGNGEVGIDERVRNMDRDVQQLSKNLFAFMEQQEKKTEAHRAERNQYRYLTYAAFLSLLANVVLIWINR